CELSQEQVAEILGIDPDTYRKYEIGTAIPSEAEIETLANIYNVSPDRLTGEFDIMKFINLRQSPIDYQYTADIYKDYEIDKITSLSKPEKYLILALRACKSEEEFIEITHNIFYLIR
ncbi:MAG: helix-turn-helix transcriptional regulator, partial [Clostridiales bacterium]|nr:helix-turn-helix transcriptional regulator [Clostridiales bacterium]